MTIDRKFVRGIWVLILTVPLNKFILRPWVIEQDFGGWKLIVVNSYPNFVEAVCGTVVLAGLLATVRSRFPEQLSKLTNHQLYWIATIIAAVYVITQEFKIHNLGGRNVYDPYDVYASVLGLLVINRLLIHVGMFNFEEKE